jgi:hypothetical protein
MTVMLSLAKWLVCGWICNSNVLLLLIFFLLTFPASFNVRNQRGIGSSGQD